MDEIKTLQTSDSSEAVNMEILIEIIEFLPEIYRANLKLECISYLKRNSNFEDEEIETIFNAIYCKNKEANGYFKVAFIIIERFALTYLKNYKIFHEQSIENLKREIAFHEKKLTKINNILNLEHESNSKN